MANELILIVEDNEKNRKLVLDVLQFKGYRLAEADTGEEGVRLAREVQTRAARTWSYFRMEGDSLRKIAYSTTWSAR